MALRHEQTDLLDRVHDRGVVASAELLTDLGQREVGELAAQVHRDLTSEHEVALAVGAADLVDRELGVRRRLRDDQRARDDGVASRADEVLQDDLRQVHVDRRLVEVGEGRDPDEGTLELADVGLHLGGDELEHVGRHREAVVGGLLAQDRDARLQLGRRDVGREAPLEPVAEPFLERLEVLRRTVRGHDDLLVLVVQGVERMEELFLRRLLALDELDVVDQEDVDLAVLALEVARASLTDGVDDVVGELLGVDVPHP